MQHLYALLAQKLILQGAPVMDSQLLGHREALEEKEKSGTSQAQSQAVLIKYELGMVTVVLHLDLIDGRFWPIGCGGLHKNHISEG